MVLLLLAVIADHHQQRPPLCKASIRIPASVSAANTPGSLRAAMWRRSAEASTRRFQRAHFFQASIAAHRLRHLCAGHMVDVDPVRVGVVPLRRPGG